MMQMHCSLFHTLAPNMLSSSLSPDQRLVFRQESLGSSRNASSPSLFIIQRRVCSPAAVLEQPAPPEPHRTSQVLQGSVGFQHFWIISELRLSPRPRGAETPRAEGAHRGKYSDTSCRVCLAFCAHHSHLLCPSSPLTQSCVSMDHLEFCSRAGEKGFPVLSIALTDPAAPGPPKLGKTHSFFQGF